MIWVDDTISTGESLRLGAKTLLEDYNMEVRAAYYLVDRSTDRKNLGVIITAFLITLNQKQPLEDEVLRNVKIKTNFDLSQIDEKILK